MVLVQSWYRDLTGRGRAKAEVFVWYRPNSVVFRAESVVWTVQYLECRESRSTLGAILDGVFAVAMGNAPK